VLNLANRAALLQLLLEALLLVPLLALPPAVAGCDRVEVGCPASWGMMLSRLRFSNWKLRLVPTVGGVMRV
jgi:hypothetical protein